MAYTGAAQSRGLVAETCINGYILWSVPKAPDAVPSPGINTSSGQAALLALTSSLLPEDIKLHRSAAQPVLSQTRVKTRFILLDVPQLLLYPCQRRNGNYCRLSPDLLRGARLGIGEVYQLCRWSVLVGVQSLHYAGAAFLSSPTPSQAPSRMPSQ